MDIQKDRHWIEEALKEAAQSGEDVPVGALVVKDGKVIGRGANQRERLNDPSAHAEIQAMRQAAALTGSWRLTDTTVYSTLEPCPMCAEAILQARVARLVFGAWDPLSGAAGSAFNLFVSGRGLPLPEVVGGIGEIPCRELLVDFFKRRRADASSGKT